MDSVHPTRTGNWSYRSGEEFTRLLSYAAWSRSGASGRARKNGCSSLTKYVLGNLFLTNWISVETAEVSGADCVESGAKK
jgi:hypothetical protein